MASIAVHTGLSRATVTAVLHGHGDERRIRPETQRRVQEAARELGYRPNASARAIRDGRFGNIGLVQAYSDIHCHYLPMELLRGLSDALSARSLHLMFKEVPTTIMDDDPFLPRIIQELSVDGLLINRIPEVSPHFIELIHKYRIPAVFLNIKEPFDSVHPDDLFAGWFMTDHLLRRGHERIAYVGSMPNAFEHYSEVDRRLGYARAMREAGREPWIYTLPDATVELPNDEPISSARQLLDRPDRPTAIVAYELAEAMAILQTARELHLVLPRDLSLIMCHRGADPRFGVPISTFTNAMHPVGSAAVEMLAEKLAAPDLKIAARAVRGEYIAGRTCAAPPK